MSSLVNPIVCKNYAPYTIFPFEDDIVADILMGKTIMHYQLNNNEVIRIFEKDGWQLVEPILDRSEEEIKNSDIKDVNFYKLRKGNCTMPIPSPWFGRLCFEMIAPKVIVEELDRLYETAPEGEKVFLLPRYTDDKNIWD